MVKVLLKALGIIVVLFITFVAAGYAWLARDRGPTHQTLAAVDMAPLIPLRDFWANQDSEWGYSLSSGGSFMSWWSVEGADTVLNVRDRSTGETQVVRPEEGQNSFYEWSYDDRHLLLTHYKDNRWSVWRIDATNVDNDWIEVTPRGFQNWRNLYIPKAADELRLITTFDRSGEFRDVYSIDQDGFGKTLLRKNPGNVDWWQADQKGAVFLRGVNVAPGKFQVEYDPKRDDAEWRPLVSYSSRDSLWILGEDGAGGLLCFSNLGREHLAAVSIDLETGKETVLFEDSSRSLDDWYAFSDVAPNMDIVELGGGYPEYRAMTPLGKSVLQALTMLESPFEMNILSTTTHGELVTLAINQQEDGWRYLLIDTRSNETEWIGTHDFVRHAASLAETDVHKIAARDGLEIPILLTRPVGVEGPAPMVALIHGGPSSHDRWEYDREVQFLANRGYVVLRVNYRGSTGFGRTFERAGDHEYGRGMQDDIQDAVQWAIDQGIADKDAVAIMGGSFGGYSAMMGVARDPEFYAAGVSIVGAVDLEYQTVHSPHFWGVDKTAWTQVIGDPEKPENLAKMREYSPINLVDQITKPVLLAHGINDRIVDRADSERFERRLRELGKPYEAYYYEKEGHGFDRWQTHVKFYRALEEFFAKHLGGRSGGFDYVEIGAVYLYP